MNRPLLLPSFLLITSVLFAPSAVFAAEAGSFNTNQVKQIQNVVHDYLVQNPQVLVEASQALQMQEMAQVQKTAQGAIPKYASQIFADTASPVIGNKEAKVTLVEFFDYQCPHCKEVSPMIEKIISSNPNLRVVLKELPIFGGTSGSAARAALAAYKQDAAKFTKFHNALMSAQNPLTDDKIMSIASSAGLDVNQLKNDMNNPAVQKEIDANFKLAQNLSIMGTPTFIIGHWENSAVSKSTFIPGGTTQDVLETAIKKASS